MVDPPRQQPILVAPWRLRWKTPAGRPGLDLV